MLKQWVEEEKGNVSRKCKRRCGRKLIEGAFCGISADPYKIFIKTPES